MSLLRGQRERFRHLRPLSLELSRRLDGEAELLETLQRLGLNVYPTDGERIGPELLDALAEAWRTERVLPGQFDVFLGQVRHAWQHLDVDRGLPDAFLVRKSHRRFEVLDSAGLAGAYLPNDAAKGRALREEDKPVLEMEVAQANRLAGALVEATPVRLASGLVERDVIDGSVWTGEGEAVRALEETRYGWLAAPLLAILAHGGANPRGHTTTAWAIALDRLRSAGVLECGSIVVELVDGEETIAKGEPAARWLSGDVLAVTNEVGHSYEALAPGLQAMLDRQDLLKDLLLVLGPLEGCRETLIRGDRESVGAIRDRRAGIRGHPQPLGREHRAGGQPDQTGRDAARSGRRGLRDGDGRHGPFDGLAGRAPAPMGRFGADDGRAPQPRRSRDGDHRVARVGRHGRVNGVERGARGTGRRV